MGNLKKAMDEVHAAKNQLSLDFGLGEMYGTKAERTGGRAVGEHGLTASEVRWILDDLVVSKIYDNNLMADNIRHYGARLSPSPDPDVDMYRKRNRFLESIAGRLTVKENE